MSREAVLARTMVELADSLVADFDIVELLTTLSDDCVEVLDIAAAGIMLATPDGQLQADDVVQRGDARRRAVRAAVRRRPVPGLLPKPPARRQPGSHQRRRSLAPLRPRRRGGRLPRRRCHPDAPTRSDHRRPQPVPYPDRVDERRRRRRRSSARRHRHHRHPAEPQDRRNRRAQRPAHHRPVESRRDRAGQRHDRRTPTASQSTKPSTGSDATPATTTCASPTSPATPSTAPSTHPRSVCRAFGAPPVVDAIEEQLVPPQGLEP